MSLLKKLISGARMNRPQPAVELDLTDPANDLPEIIYWTSAGEDLRIRVPVSWLRTWGAFGFGEGWNPMMPAVEDDFETFSVFYRLFQPRDLSDMYFLREALGPAGIGPVRLPWLAVRDGEWSPDAAGAGGPSGRARELRFFGPTSAETIEKEFRRTQKVLRSIREQGYRPDRYGDIQGYFLRLEGDCRFVVKGGKHRAAALAHTGRDTVPVCLRSGWPRVIDGDRVREWPLVRSGRMTEEYALAVMRRFFEFDGTQQRDRIFWASQPASVGTAG